MSSLEVQSSYTPRVPSITTWQVWGRMLYKEAKPLLPLLLALAVLSLLGHALIEVQGIFGQLYKMIHAVPFGLTPIFFALGAAALLVSQEKEQRTLLWYASLPIAPRQIVQSKILVGVIGVLLSWLISAVIAAPFSVEIFNIRPEAPTDILYVLPLTALFVFFLAFATAWIWGTAIPALLALIPIVIATLLLATTLTNLYHGDFEFKTDLYTRGTPLIWLISYTVVVVIVGLVARRVGSRSFVAAGGVALRKQFKNMLAYRPELNFFGYQKSGERGALLWHAWMQNRLLITALILNAFVLWILMPIAEQISPLQPVVVLLILSYALIVCWVGAFTFGADQYQRRVHFLAERGVAPSKIWLSRIVMPLGAAIFVYLSVMAIVYLDLSGTQKGTPPQFVILSGVFTLVAFAYAQWWGQVAQSRVVSLCGAPLIVVLAIGFFGSVTTSTIAPLWLVLPTLVIPFIATRVSMRAWMDRRFTLGFYVRHGLFAAASIILPLVPFGLFFATLPRMSSANHARYLAEFRQLQSSNQGKAWNLVPMTFEPQGVPFEIKPEDLDELARELESIPEPGAVTDSTTDQAEDLQVEDTSIGLGGYGMGGGSNFDLEAFKQKLHIESLKRSPPVRQVMAEFVENFDAFLESNPNPIRVSRSMEMVETDAWQKAIAVSLKPDDETLKAEWEKSTALLGKIVRRIRQSRDLADQNRADDFEKSLLQMLQLKTTKDLLDPNLYRVLSIQVADEQARRLSRRNAILASWQYYVYSSSGFGDSSSFRTQLGGLDLFSRNLSVSIKDVLIAKQTRNRTVELLMELTDASDEVSRKRIISELNKILSPDITKSLVSSWYEDWEKQAAALLESSTTAGAIQ
ncbi:hypothetical protein SH449x_004192 [Pirellulaceae bacterium SH449]